MPELNVDTNPDIKTKVLSEDILRESGARPIYLTKVEVNGGGSFSDNFFQKLFSPVLKTGDYTLSDLITKINQSRENLVKTDVFENIHVHLYPDYYTLLPSNIKKYNLEKSIPTKVIIDLKPINLNISESFINFNNEEYLNLKLNHLNNNFNGNAEVVSVGVDYNPYKPFDHLIAHGKFISSLKNPSLKFLIDFNYGQENNEFWQGTKQEILGGKIGLLYTHQIKNLDVFTGFQLFKRNLHNLDDSNSDDFKFFTGEFLKSSVIKQVKYSNLDFLNQETKNFPTDGYQFTLDSELSSNQEQTNANNRGEYFKTDFKADFYKSIFNNFITAKFEANIGGINSFNPKFPIHPSDKFYLGGYESFPGFAKNSIDLTGGDQYYKFQTTVFSKIPSFFYTPPQKENANPLRLYGTTIIGNITNSSSKTNIFNDENGAVSYGVGLRYFNNWANFDIGYYISRRFGDDESISRNGIKDGLQFSISIGGSNRR